jgi:regulator of replication initiation timing
MHETSSPTVEQLVNQLLARITALEDRVAELEDARERQREDHHALARENHTLRDSHEQLQQRVETADTERDQLNERIDHADASRGHIIEDIIDVENQLDDVEAESAEANSGDNATETPMQSPEMTPIERVSTMDTKDTGIDMTPSIERAVSIFDHWEEWSDKTPKGRVLKSGLKTLLRTATGESLAWRQIYRAAEALDELSKGRIEFTDHSRHGKMLIEFEPTRSSDCHSSSAPIA